MVDIIFFGKFYEISHDHSMKKITLNIMWTKSPYFFWKPPKRLGKKNIRFPTKGCGPGFESLASIQAVQLPRALVTNIQNISHRIHAGCIYHYLPTFG